MEFTRTRKGGDFTYVCRNVASGDTIAFPKGTVVDAVYIARVVPGVDVSSDVPTVGGEALDALILGDTITSTADFTATALKKATLGVGIGPFTAATSKTFTKTDADSDTIFNCWVVCKKVM